jgi:hypothetical protein
MDVLCFDAESNGLHGEAFAVGGVVCREGRVIERFFARCPIAGDVDPWVRDNVLPPLADERETHATAREMRNAFWVWLTTPRENTIVAVDCGWPVETGLLSACVADDPSRAFKGPYPLDEVASYLRAARLDPLASYAGVVLPNEAAQKHHPVWDATVSALCVEMSLRRIAERWGAT